MKGIKSGSRACSGRWKAPSPGTGHAPGDHGHQVWETGQEEGTQEAQGQTATKIVTTELVGLFPALVGGDALASEGWGSIQRRKYRLIRRFASIYKEPLRGTLNNSCCFALSGSRCAPPPSAPSAQTPLLAKEGTLPESGRPLPLPRAHFQSRIIEDPACG
jgi:hypothetical protein